MSDSLKVFAIFDRIGTGKAECLASWRDEAPWSKAPRYLCGILRSPCTLLAYSAEAVASAAKAGRQGYGGFSSPSSSQHPPKDRSAVAEAARYSAKENKRNESYRIECAGS